MIEVNQQSLIEALKNLKLDPHIQQETNQIYCILKHERREFPLFIRLLHDGELIQILTFIPCSIKASQLNDLSRFLHIVNKELDVPGFCIDETSSTIFYRLILPTVKKEIARETFDALINTTQLVLNTFSPAIEAMSQGFMTLDDVLKKAKETQGMQKI
jgi:hypothetical protein